MKMATWVSILVVGLLAGSVCLAQAPGGGPGGPPRGGPGGGPGGRGNRGRPGGMMMGGGRMRGGMMGRMREADANGNMLIEPEELDAALAKLKEKADTAYMLLLKGLDVDGDGKLGEEESAGVNEMFEALQGIRPYDENKNWKLEDAELAQAKERMTDFIERFNDGVLRRTDKDGDGKISPEEAEQAKKEMEERRARWQERMRERGGNRGGEGPGEGPPNQ